jgi:hypothetical protein
MTRNVAGVMLTKVNELIDETTATGPGKCHCCGEDLETAHLVGIHVTTVSCPKSEAFFILVVVQLPDSLFQVEGDMKGGETTLSLKITSSDITRCCLVNIY